MNISQKTFAIVFLTLTGLTIVLYAATRFLMLRSFLRLEENQTLNAVERARNALDDDISNLAATANDYAAWDRTYDFMLNRPSNYIRQEFKDDTLQGLNINAVMLLDTTGRIVFFKRYDPVLNREIIIPLKEQITLASDSWIRQASVAASSGIISLPDGPVEAAACPILTTERKGPVRGVLVMMRDLDARRIERLRAVTKSSLRIVPYSASFPESGNRPRVVITPLDDEFVGGSEILMDVRGNPILDMQLQARRTVFQQGEESLRYFLAALLIASLAFGVVSLLLLHGVVLKRLGGLSNEVSRIGSLKKLSERVAVRGHDELGRLGAAINEMLAALQDSEIQFRNIADNIHQVFWVVNASFEKVDYLSLAYESLWGRPRDEVYRNPLAWMEGVHPEDRKLVEDMWQNLRLGTSRATEYRIIRPDGSVRWIFDRCFPVHNEQGELKQVAGLAEDITEFKKAEQVLLRSQEDLENLVEERTAELAETMQALKHEQEHFRQLFATIPLPVWLYGESTHKFLEVNQAAVEHYGYSRDEFLQMSLDDIRPPDEMERLRMDLVEPGAGKAFSRGWRHRTKDGRIIDVEISSLRIDFTGEPAVLVAVLDVTERIRLEVELRHGQKLQAVGELAAGIAHEINTPLQFVGNNVEFLQSGFPGLLALLDKYEPICAAGQSHCGSELALEIRAAQEAADLPFLRREIPTALEQSADGLRRVTAIVQAMKKFSHVDWGPEKTMADLNEALQSTLIVANSELKYVADVETVFGDLPLVRCHLGDLNQVFLNLLVNAAHAIGDVVKDSGSHGRIRVETKTEDAWAVIAISDTGTGIPAGIRGRIFDPFFTTKAVGRGTGQGLALARAIVVEKHCGSLTFESEMGKGTTFYVRLPLVPFPVAEERVTTGK